MKKSTKSFEVETCINDSTEELKGIIEIVSGVSQIDKEEELHREPESFMDKYLTIEQNKRDQQITKLLTYYVNNYKGKINSNRKYKKFIFGIATAIIAIFSIIMAGMFISICMKYVVDSPTQSVMVSEEQIVEVEIAEEQEISVETLISLITVCITYLTLVFGILTIITKYVFPEKEEEYITDIVKAIQENDLKHKKENMRTDGYEFHD